MVPNLPRGQSLEEQYRRERLQKSGKEFGCICRVSVLMAHTQLLFSRIARVLGCHLWNDHKVQENSPKCGALVVLFHRDFRFFPRFLHRRL